MSSEPKPVRDGFIVLSETLRHGQSPPLPNIQTATMSTEAQPYAIQNGHKTAQPQGPVESQIKCGRPPPMRGEGRRDRSEPAPSALAVLGLPRT